MPPVRQRPASRGLRACVPALLLGVAAIACPAGAAWGQSPDRAPGEAPPQTPASAANEPPRFEIVRFAVAGNSVLAAAAVDLALAPYTGLERSFADVEAAVNALQRAYAQAGFGAVQVMLPEQRLTDGTVRLQVVEPPLRSVRITGAQHLDAAAVRRSLPALREGATPNTDDLAAQIRLANENPARRLSVDLKSDAAGAIDATVTVSDDKPWKIGAVVDNTGTPATGRVRTGVFLQHANFADRDHVLTTQYVFAPELLDRVAIAALNYRIPLVSLGDSIDLYGVHADVDSGVVSDLFAVRGRGSVLGVRYQHNLKPTPALRQRLLFGFEERAYDNRVGSIDGGGDDLVGDVTVHPASVGYAATWADARRQVDAGATLVGNIAGGSNGHPQDFEAARAGARPGYSLLRWSLAVAEALPHDWQLRLVAEGQATRDALVSGEQFGIGGQDSVRGFLEREFINDKGVRASVELRGPDFGERLGAGIAAQALAFYDIGHVSRNHALPGEVASTRIASVGAGLRLSFAPSITARLDAARVTRGAGSQVRGEGRLHFTLGVAY